MTLRRALGTGRRLRLIAAVRRPNVWSAPRALALSFGLLGAAAGTVHAGTRSPHPHHASVQSAGKASAHAVHDTDVRTARTSAKTSHAQHGARAQHSQHSERQEPVSAKPRKGSSAAKRARSRDDERDTGKHIAKAHKARKGHGGRYEQQIDEPQPMFRAAGGRSKKGAPQPLITKRRTHEAPAVAEDESPRMAPPSRSGLPGNVARNRARRSGTQGDDTAGNQPDTAENSAETQAGKPIPPAGPTTGPLATVTAAPAPTTALGSEVIEGFGAEVALRTPAGSSGVKTAPTIPRESAAQQQRGLRDAAEIASKPMFVPLYSREGKLVIPPPLKGSRDILVHQNQMADDAGLSRIQDDYDLARMRRTHLLVDFHESASLRVNENLPENRRSARPWTVKFATDMAHAFYQHFGEALQVNSAVRTVAYQLRLQRVNGNAAAAEGEGASPHLTGQAIDFGKRGMSAAEIGWMRSYLLPLIDAGKIDVEEEFQQACFHISVYSTYAPGKRSPARTEVAEVTRPAHARAAAINDEDDNMH